MTNTFNLTGEAQRKLLICAVDVSEGQGEPVWEIQGYKTEEASIELNPDISTVTDVLGDTYTTVNKLEASITFEPNTLRMGAKLCELMLKYWRMGKLDSYSGFKALIGYGFIGTDGAFGADVYENCSVMPNSLGGSSRVDMPFTIAFGGTRVNGTIDKLTGSDILFTPDAAV